MTYLHFRGRIIPKRINVRIEHVKHSNCRLDFLERVKKNEEKKKEAKEQGVKAKCKRQVKLCPSPNSLKLLKKKKVHGTYAYLA